MFMDYSTNSITSPKTPFHFFKNFLKVQGFSLISLICYVYLYGIVFCLYDCYTIDSQSNHINNRQDFFAQVLSYILDHFLNPFAIFFWFFIFTKIISRRPWKEMLAFALFLPLAIIGFVFSGCLILQH